MDNIIGNCEKINKLNEDLKKVSKKNARILLTGESGVGKTIIANQIHRLSEKKGNFITKASLNDTFFESELFGHKKGSYTGAITDRCGAITKADNGTLFLDEIGELCLSVQIKLLHFLETGEYSPLGSDEVKRANVRIIFATNVDLLDKVQKGEFREDLYHRINGINFEIPPLRERGDDIKKWIDYFFEIEKENNDEDFSFLKKEFMQAFSGYHWPGNIRELKQNIENTFTLGRVPDLPKNVIIINDDKYPGFFVNQIISPTEEEFKWQAKIYKKVKNNFEKIIFAKICLGETSKEKAELIFVSPFIQIAGHLQSPDNFKLLGISQVSFVQWANKLRNLNYFSKNEFENQKGKPLPTGINLTYQLRKIFIPHFLFLTLENIKIRGKRKNFNSPIAEAAFVLNISQKELLSEIKQHEQNQKKLIELNIW